jgi:hypothetical protein
VSTPQARAKARGRETENMVVGYLNDHGYPHAERRRLKGSADQGDITGIPGVVIEVKGDRSNRIREWKAETKVEAANAGAAFSVLVVRVQHKPVEDWDWYIPWNQVDSVQLTLGWPTEDWQWVRMSGRLVTELMKAVGY